MFKLIILVLLISSSNAFISIPSASYSLDKFLNSILVNHKIQEFTKGEDCDRECSSNGDQRICYFEWTMEIYSTLSSACKNCINGTIVDCFHPQCVTANGVERMIMSINRQLPAPPVIVCKNDIVVIDVKNELEGSSTAIHFHGYPHDDHQFMDGVPFITQCPIMYGTTFRYHFKTNYAGTFFYHSHAGHQKFNGAQGAFIVKENDQRDLFDEDLSEHVIFVTDWMNQLAEDSFPGTLNKLMYCDSLLINGRGNSENVSSPLTLFHVNENLRYKFKLIGATSNICPITFEIESHDFTIIATDAKNVKPFIVDKLTITAGERFDIVINTKQRDKHFYWIKIQTTEPCIDESEKSEFAILNYHREGQEAHQKLKLHHWNGGKPSNEIFHTTREMDSNNPDKFSITALEAEDFDENLLKIIPKRSFPLKLGTPPVPMEDLFSRGSFHPFLVANQPEYFNTIGAINNISFTFPSVPLLSQYDDIDEKIFCNETAKKHVKCFSDNRFCFCTHRLNAPEFSAIEFIITNAGDGKKN